MVVEPNDIIAFQMDASTELRDQKKTISSQHNIYFYTAISWFEHSPLPMHKTNCNGMFLLINPKWPPIFFASLVAAWSCKLKCWEVNKTFCLGLFRPFYTPLGTR